MNTRDMSPLQRAEYFCDATGVTDPAHVIMLTHLIADAVVCGRSQPVNVPVKRVIKGDTHGE